MKVTRLTISRFRGIKAAEFHFDGHTLMVGTNNVGKSTICEALDLVLGPDRLNRFPPLEEFDFYNGEYLAAPEVDGEPRKPVPIRIEAVLTELSQEVRNRCGGHLEFWSAENKQLLPAGGVDAANPPDAQSCLRLETLAQYDLEEDEFDAATYFSHSPDEDPGELTRVPKNIKRMFGFLYLRALRTGSRALSLERGSLLDNILRLQGVRTGLWEKIIARLRDLDISQDAPELTPVLESIEQRLTRYVPSHANKPTTKIFLSQLTREHLRKTMAFFLAMAQDQDHVPFQLAGTGTLNTLVLALLTFIADLKPETVIFAMEEPEIAVAPHTQRRIADYLLHKTTQAFVTSHSPYVIERFEPRMTLLLSRGADGAVTGQRVSDATGLKENDYKRYARKGLCECMLGKGAIIVEGITEFHALPVAARKMVEADQNLQALDIAGAAFFDAESDGQMPKFGNFFKALGLKTFSFYDHKARKAEDKQKFTQAFDVDCEHQFKGFEHLVAAEMAVDQVWKFLESLRNAGENGNVAIPLQRPVDADVRKIATEALAGHKGAGWAARLFEDSAVTDLPNTVTTFLAQVFAESAKPAEPVVEAAAQASAAGEGVPTANNA